MDDDWGKECIQTAEERRAEERDWAERECATMPRRACQWDKALNVKLRPDVRSRLVAAVSLTACLNWKASDMLDLMWHIGADQYEQDAIDWAWQSAKRHPESLEPVEEDPPALAEPQYAGPLVQCIGTVRCGKQCASHVPPTEGRCWAHKDL